MKTETNPSDNYRKDNIRILYTFSKYNKNKSFKTVTRDDIISFLDSYRRPKYYKESSSQMDRNLQSI